MKPMMKRVKTDQVVVPDRIRVDQGDTHALLRSIRDVGQIHPILVEHNGTGKYNLIAGYRRLEACKQLQIDVEVKIVDPATERVRLDRQIDENMKRKDFDDLEVSEALLLRKALYEAEHPETRVGATGGGRRTTKSDLSDSDKSPAPRYTLKASKDLGMSETKVKELLAIASLPRKYKKKIEEAKTTKERNEVAQECLKACREEMRLKRLDEQAEAQAQLELNRAPRPELPPIVLHHGDNADFMKGEEQYHLILTDPPYDRERSLVAHVARAAINPENHPWDKLEVGWVLRATPLLRKGGQMLVFCPLEAVGSYELAFKAAGLKYRMALCWCKTNPGTAHRPTYLHAVEAIVWAVKPGGKPYFEDWATQAGGASLSYIEGPICGGNERLNHPTQKPLWLIERLMRRHATKGHKVLDPFAGVGTTLVAARKLELAATGIEREDKYVRAARKRLKALGA